MLVNIIDIRIVNQSERQNEREKYGRNIFYSLKISISAEKYSPPQSKKGFFC